jgi:hypothetical protein
MHLPGALHFSVIWHRCYFAVYPQIRDLTKGDDQGKQKSAGCLEALKLLGSRRSRRMLVFERTPRIDC